IKIIITLSGKSDAVTGDASGDTGNGSAGIIVCVADVNRAAAVADQKVRAERSRFRLHAEYLSGNRNLRARQKDHRDNEHNLEAIRFHFVGLQITLEAR